MEKAECAAGESRWPKAEADFRRAMAAYPEQGFVLNVGTFHPGYNTAAVPVMGPDGRPAFGLTCSGSAATHSPAFLRKEIGPELVKVARSLEEELRAGVRGRA